MNKKLKKPPFSKKINGSNMFPLSVDVIIFFGSNRCWLHARLMLASGRDSLALPPGEDPKLIDWNCIFGRSVIAIDLGDMSEEFHITLARVLAAYGANKVVVMSRDHNPNNAVLWGC